MGVIESDGDDGDKVSAIARIADLEREIADLEAKWRKAYYARIAEECPGA